MSNVLDFRRPEAPELRAAAVMPSQAELQEAERALSHAAAALGSIDFASLGKRVAAAAAAAEADPEEDNSTDARAQALAVTGMAFAAAQSFRAVVSCLAEFQTASRGENA